MLDNLNLLRDFYRLHVSHFLYTHIQPTALCEKSRSTIKKEKEAGQPLTGAAEYTAVFKSRAARAAYIEAMGKGPIVLKHWVG